MDELNSVRCSFVTAVTKGFKNSQLRVSAKRILPIAQKACCILNYLSMGKSIKYLFSS